MTLQEIRKQYPQYDDMSDDDLVTRMHQKHYSDMPLEEFSSKIGYVPSQKTVAPTQAKPSMIGEAISNIPSSTVNLLKSTLTPILHPVETGKGLYKMATMDDDTWNNIGEYYKNRYGGWEQLEETLRKDPVGLAADVASVLSVAGGVAKGVGKVSQIAGMPLKSATTTGQFLQKAGRVTDPFTAIGKTVKLAGRGGEWAASQILGMTTGTGADAIKQAFQGGKAFKAGLRGKINAQDVMSGAMDALEEIKIQRRQQYQQALEGIAGKSNVMIDARPIWQKLDDTLQSFRVNKVYDKNGAVTYDFGKSTLDRSARGPMLELIEDVRNWDDWSPLGTDALKQRVDDFYAPNKNSRAIVTALKNSIKKEIVKKVPEYENMTRDYHTMSNHIDDISKNLLSGRTDTVLRRLNSIFRDVNDYRRTVLDKLDTMTGGDLKEQLAGVALNPALPRGWPSKVIPTGMAGAMAFYNPALSAGMLMAESPRLMGEAALKAGQIGRGVGGGAAMLGPYWKYLYQTGRLQEQQ